MSESQSTASWRCKYCGCDDMHACEKGCYWVSKDVCSACVINGKARLPLARLPIPGRPRAEFTRRRSRS